MMDVKSLEDCQPFVTKDGSIIRELLAHRNSAIRQQSLAEARLPVGAKTQPHYHRKTEEIYLITAGQGVMHLADEARSVAVGDAIAIPPGCPHWIENDGDTELRLLCCCAPGYEHEDTVLIEAD
jgi:mannose-6-phosphate isomerase-like protein (cupin superfamily)